MAQVTPPAAASLPSASPSAAPTPPPATLDLGVVRGVNTLDPLYASLAAERDIDALIFRGLTRAGPNGTLVGDLAASWTIADTGHTYTFQLRRDLQWADGQPVTAEDVAYTIHVLQDPAYDGPYGAVWRGVTVATPDEATVVLRLTDPAAAFLDVTTQAIVPAHLLRDTPVDQLTSLAFETQPVGDGPYQLDELDSDHARLVLGPHLPAAASGAIPVITFQFYNDAGSLATAFQDGAVDSADGLTPDLATALAGLPGARAIAYPQATLTAAVMNVRVGQPLFRDARVRSALLRAIDRPSLVQAVFDGAATIATSPFLPAATAAAGASPAPSASARASATTSAKPSPTSSPAASVTPLAAATTALAAAGWKRQADGWHAPGVKTAVGFEVVTVQAAANPTLDAVARAVVQAWTALGLHVTLAELAPAALVRERLQPHDFQVAIIDMDLGLDADLQPLLTSSQAIKGGTNLAGFESSAFDKLLANAHVWSAPATLAARRAAVASAFTAQLPFLPLVFPDEVVLYRNAVVGPTATAIGEPSERFWDVLTWRLTP